MKFDDILIAIELSVHCTVIELNSMSRFYNVSIVHKIPFAEWFDYFHGKKKLEWNLWYDPNQYNS